MLFDNPNNFDPFGQDYRDNPRSFYPELLRTSPGFITMEGIPSVYVAKYGQAKTVLLNFKQFSSLKPANLPGMERVDFFNSLPVMNYSDPPDHQRLRRLVSGAFSPQRIVQYQNVFMKIAHSLLEQIDGASGFDVMSHLTKPLFKELLLTHFMGVEEADHPIFVRYLETLVLLDKVSPGSNKPKAFLDAWAAGVEYCTIAAAKARRDKSQNLIGLLIEALDAGGKLSNDEMMAMMVVLFIGGLTTAASAAGSALINLARYPNLAARIRTNPELSMIFLEESLRTDSVVSLLMRFTLQDTEIAGKIIRKGTPIYAMIAAACYDNEVFSDPEIFDIDRPNIRDHLALGQGIHTCIGNTIVRAVIPNLINLFANRYPNLKLIDPEGIKYESNPRARHLSTAWLST
jgi:cytochrome P450